MPVAASPSPQDLLLEKESELTHLRLASIGSASPLPAGFHPQSPTKSPAPSSLNPAETQVAQLRSWLDESQHQLMVTQELLSAKETEVRKLNGQLKAEEEALASLAEKLDEAAGELRRVKAEEEAAAAAAAAGEGENGGVQGADGPSAAQLEHEVNAARAAAVEANTLRAVAAEQLREAQGALSGARVELEEVRSELRASQAECERLQAGSEGLKGRVRELEGELEEGVAQRVRAVAEAQAAVDALQEKVVILEQQRKELLQHQQEEQQRQQQQAQANGSEANRAGSGGSSRGTAQEDKGWQLVGSGGSSCLEPATPDQATGAAAAAAAAANGQQAVAENGKQQQHQQEAKDAGEGQGGVQEGQCEEGSLGFKLMLAQSEVHSLKAELSDMQQQWEQLLQLIKSNAVAATAAADDDDEAENNGDGEALLAGEQQQGLLLQLVEGLQVKYTGPSLQQQLRMEGRQMEALLGLALEQVQLIKQTAELSGSGAKDGMESYDEGLGSTVGGGFSRAESGVVGKLSLGVSAAGAATGSAGGGMSDAGMYRASCSMAALQSDAIASAGNGAGLAGGAMTGLQMGDEGAHGLGVHLTGYSKGVSDPLPVVSGAWNLGGAGVSENGATAGGHGGMGAEDFGLEDAWWNKPTVVEPVMELPDFLLKR